jgi:hypothetical protein
MAKGKYDALIEYAVKQSEGSRGKAREWTEAEEQFLRDNLGKMTDEEMGKALGRTRVAVLLHWKRDMQLTSPSKVPTVLTAHQAARVLGIDAHKTCHWVDVGFIKGRLMAGGRKIRLIERADLIEWAMNHDHWMYFDRRRVKDTELMRLLDKEAKRWNDDWWPTVKVARYHRVRTADVKRYIHKKKIRAEQIRVSKGGRDLRMSWRFWFVRKSEATRKDLIFYVQRGGKRVPSLRRAQ